MTAKVIPFPGRPTRPPSEDDVVGNCDWGNCDRDSFALRWADDLNTWLSVCSRHTAPPWVPLP